MEHPLPDSPIELDEYSETMAERLREAFSLVRKELNCAFERNKRRYDAKVKEVQFSSGDLVWFYCPRTKPGIGRKWQSLTNGPMLVVRKVNAVNYAIKRSPTAKPFIVHIDRIRHYRGEVPEKWKRAIEHLTHVLTTGAGKGLTESNATRNFEKHTLEKGGFHDATHRSSIQGSFEIDGEMDSRESNEQGEHPKQ
jgi:hypothetical protein